MRLWKSVLGIGCCLALGLGLISTTAHAQFKPNPAPGQPNPGKAAPKAPAGGQQQALPPLQPDQFRFAVCNRTKIPLFVGVMYKVDGNNWRTIGWVPYKPGECATLTAAFPRNDFYWYAEDGPGNVTYSGTDAYSCINSNGDFDRTISGDYSCAAEEKVVGFTKIDATSIQNGVTLTE